MAATASAWAKIAAGERLSSLSAGAAAKRFKLLLLEKSEAPSAIREPAKAKPEPDSTDPAIGLQP
ncbi:MAG: hypothetical protein WC683_19800 [bacterium]